MTGSIPTYECPPAMQIVHFVSIVAFVDGYSRLFSILQNDIARYISLQNWRAMVIGSYPYLLWLANFANCILDCILNMIHDRKNKKDG